jgi:hypothetical protein
VRGGMEVVANAATFPARSEGCGRMWGVRAASLSQLKSAQVLRQNLGATKETF